MQFQNYTLEHYINYWLQTVKKNSVKPGSYKRLETAAIMLHEYSISQMEISKINLGDIQKYLNQMVDDGYSYSTINKQRLIVTAPLRYAYQAKVLAHNCTEGVVMPSRDIVLKPQKEITAIPKEEQELLLKAFRDDPRPVTALLEFMLETGLRIGEAQALYWSDVDWSRKAISITKTVLNGSRKQEDVTIIQRTPKTKSSIRKIPLSIRALEILKQLSQNKNGRYIFCNCDTPLRYDYINKRLKRYCEQAKIPNYSLHSLRHTFATNCYYKGCNVKILSKLLGHSSTTITYNTYINLYGDALEEMRAVVN